MKESTLWLSLLLLVPLTGHAQQPACDAPAHRQFDFWIGEWEVRDAEGKLAGHNRIEKTLGGCVLHESWRGAQGVSGESFNVYSERHGRWHQTWVDSGGTLLLLDGGLEGDRMVLSGTHPGREGGEVLHQISWELLDDGRVKQHWRASKDGGGTWQDLFVGFYSKGGS